MKKSIKPALYTRTNKRKKEEEAEKIGRENPDKL